MDRLKTEEYGKSFVSMIIRKRGYRMRSVKELRSMRTVWRFDDKLMASKYFVVRK